MKQMFIYVTTQTEFIHRYPDAPDEVAYLRYPHRHLLHVKAKIEVYSNDRELEFIMVKHELSHFLFSLGSDNIEQSGEDVACSVLQFLQNKYGTDRDVEITISEDGENGCELIYRKES